MNKSVKKLLVSGATLLMMAIVSAGVGSLSRPAHGASQAEVAKLFASKDPNKAMHDYAIKHGAKPGHDVTVKLTPAEQRQQEREDAISDKQDEKAEIMQEEDGAHVNAYHAKILIAGSMAMSNSNAPYDDELYNALSHRNYRLIKRLTAKVTQLSKKSTRRHKTHKHYKKSKRTARKRRRRIRARRHKSRKHRAESNAEIIESLRKQGVPKSGRMKIDLLTPDQKRDEARATAWANKVDMNEDIKAHESEGMTRSQAIASIKRFYKEKRARFANTGHHNTKKHNRRHANKRHGRRTMKRRGRRTIKRTYRDHKKSLRK